MLTCAHHCSDAITARPEEWLSDQSADIDSAVMQMASSSLTLGGGPASSSGTDDAAEGGRSDERCSQCNAKMKWCICNEPKRLSAVLNSPVSNARPPPPAAAADNALVRVPALPLAAAADTVYAPSTVAVAVVADCSEVQAPSSQPTHTTAPEVGGTPEAIDEVTMRTQRAGTTTSTRSDAGLDVLVALPEDTRTRYSPPTPAAGVEDREDAGGDNFGNTTNDEGDPEGGDDCTSDRDSRRDTLALDDEFLMMMERNRSLRSAEKEARQALLKEQHQHRVRRESEQEQLVVTAIMEQQAEELRQHEAHRDQMLEESMNRMQEELVFDFKFNADV